MVVRIAIKQESAQRDAYFLQLPQLGFKDVEAEAGSGPFSVEAKARKIHRFRFHIGGKNRERKKLVLLSFVEERIGGA